VLLWITAYQFECLHRVAASNSVHSDEHWQPGEWSSVGAMFLGSSGRGSHPDTCPMVYGSCQEVCDLTCGILIVSQSCRRHYFARKFESILPAEATQTDQRNTVSGHQSDEGCLEQQGQWPCQRGGGQNSVGATLGSNGSESDQYTRHGDRVTEGKTPSLRSTQTSEAQDDVTNSRFPIPHCPSEHKPDRESMEFFSRPKTVGSHG
jgi:hypothetical protein